MGILDRALNVGEGKQFRRYEQRVEAINGFEPELELDFADFAVTTTDHLPLRSSWVTGTNFPLWYAVALKGLISVLIRDMDESSQWGYFRSWRHDAPGLPINEIDYLNPFDRIPLSERLV